MFDPPKEVPHQVPIVLDADPPIIVADTTFQETIADQQATIAMLQQVVTAQQETIASQQQTIANQQMTISSLLNRDLCQYF